VEPDELIKALETAPKANRKLDEAIAIIAGYTRVYERVPSSNGQQDSRVLWVPPGRSKGVSLPGFTNSIDIARQFAEIIRPKRLAACSWHENGAKAQIDDGQICVAATPALALCLAAAKAYVENKSKGNARS
jgi:hypothetical protein